MQIDSLVKVLTMSVWYTFAQDLPLHVPRLYNRLHPSIVSPSLLPASFDGDFQRLKIVCFRLEIGWLHALAKTILTDQCNNLVAVFLFGIDPSNHLVQ